MKPILRWQRDQLAKELLLLQGHISDPTCPCKTEGEKCVRKHLLTIEALAQETIPIEESDARAEELGQLANEARELREEEEKNLCGQKPHYKWPIDTWSRNWRKKFETMACEISGHKGAAKMHQEADMESHFSVDVTVSGPKGSKKVSLMVDTGATASGIPQADIDELGLAEMGDVETLNHEGAARKPYYVGWMDYQGVKLADIFTASELPHLGVFALELRQMRVNPIAKQLEYVGIAPPGVFLQGSDVVACHSAGCTTVPVKQEANMEQKLICDCRPVRKGEDAEMEICPACIAFAQPAEPVTCPQPKPQAGG